MVEVELNAEDYKVILSWYELAFANNHDKQKEVDLEAMHKLMIMCKALIDEHKQFTSNNDKD